MFEKEFVQKNFFDLLANFFRKNIDQKKFLLQAPPQAKGASYAPEWRNKDKHITVRFSVRNCTYTDVKCITKHQYSNDLWPFKIKRNCIVDKSLAV
jgi:hypothetical protein